MEIVKEEIIGEVMGKVRVEPRSPRTSSQEENWLVTQKQQSLLQLLLNLQDF